MVVPLVAEIRCAVDPIAPANGVVDSEIDVALVARAVAVVAVQAWEQRFGELHIVVVYVRYV